MPEWPNGIVFWHSGARKSKLKFEQQGPKD